MTADRDAKEYAVDIGDLDEDVGLAGTLAGPAVAPVAPTTTSTPTGAGAGAPQVLREVGAGAAGMVYEARDPALLRSVAYKQLHTKLLKDRFVVSHFLSEARITAQLDHPNIIPIYALMWDGAGTPSYTMKLIEGRTLRDLVKECRSCHQANVPLDAEHALPARLEHFLKVCDAMAYAHSKGVIHRDLKPENVMIGRFSEVYVMDWGIARPIGARGAASGGAAEGEGAAGAAGAPAPAKGNSGALALQSADEGDAAVERTQMGALVGSVPYMSPEQARGENDTLDARSDQYALGVMLYELVTIRRAVSGKTLYETLNKVVRAHVEPFVHLDETTRLPPELRAIVRKATCADRAGRYPDVAALADDVRRYLRGESISAMPERAAARLFRWINRHRELSVAVGSLFLFVVTAALGGTAIWSLRSQRAAAEERRHAAEERRHALEVARAREQHLTRLVGAVAEGRSRLDAHFSRVEGLLGALSAAATQAILRGRPSKEPVYLDLDFEAPGRAPPDFRDSPLYHRKISLDWPVVKLAPTAKAKKLRPLLRQIAPLRGEFRELFLRGAAPAQPPEGAPAVWHLLGEGGGPITWAFIGLEQGVMYAYPGKAGYPPEYDPRQRPWYALGKGRRGIAWGNPYVDALGAGLLLPSAMALRGPGGALLGVAGVECTFDYIIEHLLALPGVPGLRQSFLVDEQGRVVVSSARKGERFAAGRLLGALTLPQFPVPAVAQAIRAGGGGLHEGTVDGKRALIAFQRLVSLGWYLVVVTDPEAR